MLSPLCSWRSGETEDKMKTGIKSIELDDYNEIQDEVGQLEWLMNEFRVQTPNARIDAPDTLSHRHKMWEWGRALKAIKEIYGDNKNLRILDIGAAYSLLGPALAYLGYPVTEVEPDAGCGKEREKINPFLSKFNGQPIYWKQAGYGTLLENCARVPGYGDLNVFEYDVVMSISTIEHIDLWLEKAAWKEMADLTKPGGLLIVTTDLMPKAKKGYMFDDCRWTNYSMEMIEARVKELRSYGFKPLGKEDYQYHGTFVHDYSFASIHMVKDK